MSSFLIGISYRDFKSYTKHQMKNKNNKKKNKKKNKKRSMKQHELNNPQNIKQTFYYEHGYLFLSVCVFFVYVRTLLY